MQRRGFLKLMLPLGALSLGALAGCRPSATVDCLSNPAEWWRRLKTFADPVLGKAAAMVLPAGGLQQESREALCASDFADRFRQQAAADFAAGRTISLEGWVVSETEAFMHRAIYLADVPPAVGSVP